MAYRKKQQPRCMYCGRFFIPDYRVKDRQKSCGRDQCNRARKREAHQAWEQANPGYYRGRYPNTKQYREGRPGYQKQLRGKKAREIQDEIGPRSPVKTLRIVVTGNWPVGEIQDEIILARRCGCGFYVGGWKNGREIQDEIDLAVETGYVRGP